MPKWIEVHFFTPGLPGARRGHPMEGSAGGVEADVFEELGEVALGAEEGLFFTEGEFEHLCGAQDAVFESFFLVIEGVGGIGDFDEAGLPVARLEALQVHIAVEFGFVAQALNTHGDLAAEFIAEVIEGDFGFVQHVVKQGGGEHGRLGAVIDGGDGEGDARGLGERGRGLALGDFRGVDVGGKGSGFLPEWLGDRLRDALLLLFQLLAQNRGHEVHSPVCSQRLGRVDVGIWAGAEECVKMGYECAAFLSFFQSCW